MSAASARDDERDLYEDCCVVRASLSQDAEIPELLLQHEWNCTLRSEARLDRELPQLLATPWYWNTDKRAVAEELLSSSEEGRFLVRRCGSLPNVEFVLSVRVRSGASHYAIPFCNDMKRYYLQQRDCRDNPAMGRRLLVDFIRMLSAQPAKFKLRSLSPKQRVPELKDFCRAVIRQVVDSDRVDRLPLSKPMKRYLLVETYKPIFAH